MEDEKKSKNLGVQFIKKIAGQANTLTIPRIFIDLTMKKRKDGKWQRDLNRALFLSQCTYWEGIKKGEFYKSDMEWCEELGMVRSVLIAVRNDLVKMGFIEIKLKGRINYYQVNWGKIEEEVINIIGECPKVGRKKKKYPNVGQKKVQIVNRKVSEVLTVKHPKFRQISVRMSDR